MLISLLVPNFIYYKLKGARNKMQCCRNKIDGHFSVMRVIEWDSWPRHLEEFIVLYLSLLQKRSSRLPETQIINGLLSHLSQEQITTYVFLNFILKLFSPKANICLMNQIGQSSFPSFLVQQQYILLLSERELQLSLSFCFMY